MKEFGYKEIETATKGFSVGQLIGKGSHGSVYKGLLKDRQQLVAVKKASEGLLQIINGDANLQNEIDILSSVNHNPSIVNLVGVCRSSPSSSAAMLLVMEFMNNGSLHDLLHSNSLSPPSWRRRAVTALQVARAVLSLHGSSPAIIHRDIKSANILFDRKWNAKLADFSLAVRVAQDKSSARSNKIPAAGTMGYLDPCYTESGDLGPENDVFSFGVVLLELISSRKAMDMDCDPSSIVAWAVPKIRASQYTEVCDGRIPLPELVKVPVGRMLRVAAECVSEEVERRPLMKEVVEQLEEVVESMYSWPWRAVRSKLRKKVHGCMRAWRRCVRKKVNSSSSSTTRNIVCRDHLVHGGVVNDDHVDHL